GVLLRNAESAAQVAAREVKQMRGDQLPLLTVLDAVLEHPGRRVRPARSTLARLPIRPATVLAQHADPRVPPGAVKSLVAHCRIAHQPRPQADTSLTGVPGTLVPGTLVIV